MVAQLHKLYPMPRRSHHHQIDEDANVKVYDLRWTDDELRQMWKSDDLSAVSGNLALDVPTRSNAGHSDEAGYGKPRILQLSNAPVVTFPVYTLFNLPPELDFKAEIAWMALGETIDAFVADFMQATGFVTVYGVDLSRLNALNLNGLTVKQSPDRATVYGSIKILTGRKDEIAACGVRASQVYRDVPLSSNLLYRYTWRSGVQQAVMR